ncbi:sensor histidine kinase [Vallicoccus soli]|uniref:histidine kinase n=1 Tax=Vallicoccus soli TaxID=2339232 RepID=A0A3A3ZLT5_9ACTN|nr:sensor histidine kinase [Vallicoccus soli]
MRRGPAPGGPTTAGGLPRTAAAVGLLAWGLGLASAVLLAAARPPATEGLWFYAVDVTVAAVYGTVAAVVLSRRRHVVPWLLALAAVGGGLAALGYAWGELSRARPAVPPLPWLVDLQGIAWVPGTLALFLVVPWLVRDHPLGRARWGLAAGSALTVAVTAVNVLHRDGDEPPLYLAAIAVGLLAAADAALRRARGPVAERVGLGWLAVGTLVMALSFLPLAVPSLWTVLPLWFLPSLHLAAQAVFPGAVLVAVLRQRMWGLDLPVSRAVLGGLLTTGLVVLYVAVATVAARLLPGGDQVLAAAAVAVAVQPARTWLQRRVTRLVHGDAVEPTRTVRRLGRHLGRAQTADELLAGLVETVGAALRLESAELVVEGATAAAWGAPTSTPVDVRLVHGTEEVAVLRVTAPPGEALGARERRALDELASVVSAGVALARTSRDLEAARDRLTSVRLEERRVVRRELHDGLGPSLAGIRLALQGARNLVATDPAAAGELLAALQAELDARVDDVRALSRSLLPPALETLGLGPALSELAARHREAGLEVEVRCDGADGLEPRLAAATYGIVVEAVTNVARHSGATRCTVEVVVEDAVLVVVDDDGTGVPADAVPGVGTSSMRERAQEQGGSLAVLPLQRGTRVRAELPVGLR